jgi:hypothetical protein
VFSIVEVLRKIGFLCRDRLIEILLPGSAFPILNKPARPSVIASCTQMRGKRYRTSAAETVVRRSCALSLRGNRSLIIFSALPPCRLGVAPEEVAKMAAAGR